MSPTTGRWRTSGVAALALALYAIVCAAAAAGNHPEPMARRGEAGWRKVPQRIAELSAPRPDQADVLPPVHVLTPEEEVEGDDFHDRSLHRRLSTNPARR
jgi:hypothetical protein